MIPKENYGNLNNVPPKFGPPTWEDAKIEIEGERQVQIDIEIM